MQRRGRLSVKLAADYEDSKNSETQEQQSSRGDWFCESVEDCGEKSTEDHWFHERASETKRFVVDSQYVYFKCDTVDTNEFSAPQVWQQRFYTLF